jgi:multiple sugar transport system permease protein
MGGVQLSFKQKHFNNESVFAYCLLLPAVVLLFAFMVYPIINVFIMSLYDTDRLARLGEFAGLQNYIDIFTDNETWEVFFRSIFWTVAAVSVKTVLGIIIALLLNVEYKGRKLARLLFILPWASSVPISAMLWRWVLHHEFGLLNHTLKGIMNFLGITAELPVWLGDKISAFLSCLWVDIWIGVPFMALVFLAGMQAISKDLYESAEIDGANKFQQFLYITIPGIRNLLLIATLLSSLWTFNDFNVIYIMTRGGPAGATDILITHVYKSSFQWGNWHYASVLSILTFLILSVVSIIYARVYFKKEKS